MTLTDFERPLLDSLVLAVDRNRELDAAAVGTGTTTTAVTLVRRLDWIEECERPRATGDAIDTKKPTDDDDDDDTSGEKGWKEMDDRETFDFVFGSDLLYEEVHALTLPGVIKRRVAAPNGRCRIVGAVRNRAMLDVLVENMRKEGLAVVETHLRDNDTNAADWYEDGYCALEVTHDVE